MSGSVVGMAKTEQVRLPVDLVADARIVCAATGESLPGYVARVVREAVRKDLPKASKRIADRAKQVESGEAD